MIADEYLTRHQALRELESLRRSIRAVERCNTRQAMLIERHETTIRELRSILSEHGHCGYAFGERSVGERFCIECKAWAFDHAPSCRWVRAMNGSNLGRGE